MRDWFLEILYVIAISKRTQWAIILGVVLFFIISALGHYMTANIEFVGPMAALQDTFSHNIMSRYDKVALATLISFWVLAFKSYRRDKKRFDL